MRRAPRHPASPPPPLPWGPPRCPTLNVTPSPPLGCGCSSTGLPRWAGGSVPCRPSPRARSSASKFTLKREALLTPQAPLRPPASSAEDRAPLCLNPRALCHHACLSNHQVYFQTSWPPIPFALSTVRPVAGRRGFELCSGVCPSYPNLLSLTRLTCKAESSFFCAPPPLCRQTHLGSLASTAEKPSRSALFLPLSLDFSDTHSPWAVPLPATWGILRADVAVQALPPV